MSLNTWRATSNLLRLFLRSEPCTKHPFRIQNRFACEKARFISYSRVARAATSVNTYRQRGPTQRSIIVYTPSEKDLVDAELEVDLIPTDDALINITDAAAEVSTTCILSFSEFLCKPLNYLAT